MSQIFVPTSGGGGGGSVNSVNGTNGVTASPTTGAVVVSGVNATTSTVGVASFDPTEFIVTNGAVTLSGSNSLEFITNNPDGFFAVPHLNQIEFEGEVVAFGTLANTPVFTDAPGSANIVTVSVQVASAQPSSVMNDVGLSSFNSSQFIVDTNGYVSLKGGPTIPAIQTINNIGPTASGNFTISGTANQVAVTGGTNSDTISLIGPYTPTTYTLNGVLYGNTTSSILATGTANNGVLISGNTGIPSFLANGTAGFILTANTGAPPTWQASPTVTITITGDAGGAQAGSSFTISGGTTGFIFTGASTIFTLSGILKLVNGGTNAALVASAGGIFYSTATAGAILSGTATANQMLQSGSSAAPAWSTATWPATTTINQILYSSAANTVTGLTTGNNGVLITSNVGQPLWLANSSTPGYVLTANSGAPPSWQPTTSSGGLLVVTGQLTSSQIKNLHASPIQIIAAPGSGNLIVIVETVATLNYGGTNTFTGSGGQSIGLFYGTGQSTLGANASGFILSNASIISNTSKIGISSAAPSVMTPVDAGYTACVNMPVNIYNNTGSEISGNAANDNTISYNILYRIITIP